jgi:hypothetical protein
MDKGKCGEVHTGMVESPSSAVGFTWSMISRIFVIGGPA